MEHVIRIQPTTSVAVRPILKIGASALHSPCQKITAQTKSMPIIIDKSARQQQYEAYGSSPLKNETTVSTFQAFADLKLVLNDFIRTNSFGRAIAANQIGIPYQFLAVKVLGMNYENGTVLPPSEISKEEKDKFNHSVNCLDAAGFNNGFVTFDGILCNPKISWASENDIREVWDDCFSFPETLVRVPRYRSITVDSERVVVTNPKNVTFEGAELNLQPRKWEKLDANISELLQHEIDHLHGLTAFDRLAGRETDTSLPSLVEKMKEKKLKKGDFDVDPVVIMREEFDKNPEKFMKMLRY